MNWDRRFSVRIHNAGMRHLAAWAVLSRWGLWGYAVVVFVVWVMIGKNTPALLPVLWSLLIGFFGVMVLRMLIRRPRPKVIKTSYRALFRWSFPSLHASVGFSIATSLAFIVLDVNSGLFGWIFAILLFGYAGMISITRLFVGVHYASDILVGGLLGVVIAVLVYLV